MVRVGSRLREEFPRGWWRSRRWWSEGLRELGLDCLLAVATVLFIGCARSAVRQRHDPQALAAMRGSDEGYVAGLLVGCAGLAVAACVTVAGLSWIWLGSAMGLWFLANAAVAATVLVVLGRSRLARREQWAQLDFVDRHLPRYGRPPETVEEYRAMRLNAQREAGQNRRG